MKKSNLSLIGLLQALGVAIYTSLISGLLKLLNNFLTGQPGIIGSVLMLTTLVFSVAVVGSLVFGYASYLALNKKLKEALHIIGYTLLFLLLIIGILIIIMFLV